VIDNYSQKRILLFFIFIVTGFNSWSSTKELTSNSVIVSLLAFEANPLPEKVSLNWTTSVEINNEYFLVERSTDGKTFEVINRIKGAVNSTNLLDYSSIDNSPLYGTSYYRLKQIDSFGNSTYSDVIAVSIKENPDFEILSAEPTINSTIHLLFISAQNDKCSVRIFDHDGSEVYHTGINVLRGTNSKELTCSYLEKGLYLVSISNEKEILSKKYMVLP
jgi:hypothetical protein